MLLNINKDNPIICWFSGGVTSAIACKLAIDLYGKDKQPNETENEINFGSENNQLGIF